MAPITTKLSQPKLSMQCVCGVPGPWYGLEDFQVRSLDRWAGLIETRYFE
jgi:hypothetical protein